MLGWGGDGAGIALYGGTQKTKQFHPLLSLYEIQVQKQRAGSYLCLCWVGEGMVRALF
jgi:hypothetical protein